MSTVEREHVVAPSMPAVLDPRVERGAALLDEKVPGWFGLIDLDRFDLSATDRCVLGQIGLCVYSTDYYKTVPKLLNLTPEELGNEWGGSEAEMHHGFWASGNGTTRLKDWALLDQDWRLAILSRQS